MTLSVTLTHANPGYCMDALVTLIDHKGMAYGTATDTVAANQKRVSSGQSITLCVHAHCSLHVEEVPALLPAVSQPPSEQPTTDL